MKNNKYRKILSIVLAVIVSVTIMAPCSIVFGADDPDFETVDKIVKKSSTLKGVTTSHSKSYSRTITDSITVSPAYGRSVELYYYDSNSSTWVLINTYTLPDRKTGKITITYPELWKHYSCTSWKIVCPQYKRLISSKEKRSSNKIKKTNTYYVYSKKEKKVKINNKLANAKAAIVMEADTGEVLYSQNVHAHLKIGSLTKMVTSMLAVDLTSLDDKVTITKEAPEARKMSGGMGLVKGDVVLMDDLLHATLIESANDAAAAIACAISGSQTEFATLMKEKSLSLGAAESTYRYAFGDWHSNTYSTAYDQAIISSELMTNPDYEHLRSIIVKPNYSFTSLGKQNKYSFKMGSISTALVKNGSSLGIKSGYNPPAKWCYANAWECNGHLYVSVVLGSSSNKKNISSQKKLMSYTKYMTDASQ